MSAGPFHSSPQDITVTFKQQAPAYAFLSHPPPQKKRPTQPLPSPPQAQSNLQKPSARRRSRTFSTIVAWASHVQPGSPAPISPHSPRRRPSVTSTRRPSIGIGRKASITSTRVPSGSFLNIIDTPTTAYRSATTPSVANFKADLTAVGYTSVFVHLPNTPLSAALPIVLKSAGPDATHIPIPPIPVSPSRQTRTLTRSRSLSVLKLLRKRAQSKTTSSPPSPPAHKMKSKVSSDAIAKRKRAKYAATRPAPLANELALMQFADGGNMDSHIKRVMDAQAKAVAGPGRVAGVGDVYRDGEGGIWWDQAEEWEYAHLLGGSDPKTQGTGDMDWVTFENGAKSPKNAHTLIAPCTVGESEERRGSVSTQDSDLDPQYIVQPTDHFDTDDLAVFGSALVPLVSRKPAMSVLALPARSRRTAKHLRKPEYMIDAAFPRIPGSPKGARFPASATGTAAKPKPKGKARRRPAPLTLSPPSPAFKQPSSSPLDAEKARKHFIGSSFEPAVPATPATPSTAAIAQATVDTRGKLTSRALNLPFRNVNSSTASLPAKKSLGVKPSRLNMNVMGLFRSNRKEGVVH